MKILLIKATTYVETALTVQHMSDKLESGEGQKPHREKAEKTTRTAAARE